MFIFNSYSKSEFDSFEYFSLFNSRDDALARITVLNAIIQRNMYELDYLIRFYKVTHSELKLLSQDVQL